MTMINIPVPRGTGEEAVRVVMGSLQKWIIENRLGTTCDSEDPMSDDFDVKVIGRNEVLEKGTVKQIDRVIVHLDEFGGIDLHLFVLDIVRILWTPPANHPIYGHLKKPIKADCLQLLLTVGLNNLEEVKYFWTIRQGE